MDKLIKKTTLYGMGFFVIFMCVIVYFSVTKTIAIEHVNQDDFAQANVGDNEGTADLEELNDSNSTPSEDMNTQSADNGSGVESNEAKIQGNSLAFSTEDKNTDYLCIPLPPRTKVENISIENHYMDLKLYVLLNDVEEDFFAQNLLSGNHDNIDEASITTTENGVSLCFYMKDLFEYKTVLENDALYISFYSPREIYDKIVVIDPACGGSDNGDVVNGIVEKDVVLKVASVLKQKLDESDVKCYFTRMDDVNPDNAKRIALANDTKADMYIRLETDVKEDSSIYGVTCLYNDDYFIPGFGNIELSDVMESSVITEIKSKALGLVKSSEEDKTLIYSTVPSTIIKIGCISNKQEAILLGRDDYIEKMAQGIYNGIMEVYE